MVSTCSTAGSYIEIWSVVTDNDASVQKYSSIQLDNAVTYGECMAVHADTAGQLTRAFLRNRSNGTNYIMKVQAASSNYTTTQQLSTSQVNFTADTLLKVRYFTSDIEFLIGGHYSIDSQTKYPFVLTSTGSGRRNNAFWDSESGSSSFTNFSTAIAFNANHSSIKADLAVKLEMSALDSVND